MVYNAGAGGLVSVRMETGNLLPADYPDTELTLKLQSAFSRIQLAVGRVLTDPFISTDTEYDNEGKEIPNTKKTVELEPYFIRRQIVRIRTKDKKEFLYSRGHLYGYTTYGEELSKKFQEPEIWKQQAFKHHMEFIAKDNKHKNVCDGPTAGSIIHYTLPYTPENVDTLMKNAIPNVALKVREEGGTVKDAPDLDTFRNKSFDYILNMDYLSDEKKAAKLEEFQTMQAGAKKK